mmetsp:Transcript_966/g.1360  ORF Transcript_966/g.1360 Transcript_966/m.1360 type:complete len:389 (-) Transcript_966:96-1262(-)
MLSLLLLVVPSTTIALQYSHVKRIQIKCTLRQFDSEKERWPIRIARRIDAGQQRILRKTAKLSPAAQLGALLVIYIAHTALLSQGCLAFPVQLIPNEIGLFQSLGYDSVAGLSVLLLRGVYLATNDKRNRLSTTIKEKEMPWKIDRTNLPSIKRLGLILIALIFAYLGSGLAAVLIDDALLDAQYYGFPISMGMHRSLHVLLSHLVWVAGGATILRFALSNFFPKRNQQSQWFSLKFRQHWLPWALGGYFVSALAFNCADALNQLVVPECLFEDDTIVSYMINPEDNDIAALATGAIAPCLTAPWWEELAYRGFLLPVLATHFPLAAAIPISAILFSAHHATLTAGLPLAVLGLIWASIYVQSRNLLVTILIHGMWNARVFLGTLFGI